MQKISKARKTTGEKEMATGQNINTYFLGTWHEGNAAVINAADHGAWLGSNVFDGARYFDGVAPDLLAHCKRVNNSAEALMLKPTVLSLIHI